MTTDDLTPKQRQRLHDTALKHLDYFNRLMVRMKGNAFPTNDRLYLGVLKAQAAGIEFMNATAELPGWAQRRK